MASSTMQLKDPRMLVDSIANGTWKSVSPDSLRRYLGEDLDDLQLFEGLQAMDLIAQNLDHAGFVDHPEFCMTRSVTVQSDPRLNFNHALFIGGSVIPGDDVFVAILRKEFEEYDPPVLVLDWRKSVPDRWTERCKLSDLIRGIRACDEARQMRSSSPEIRSPAIVLVEWGKIEVDGLGTFRDVKLYPGGRRDWDWRETDTHHVPGIQPSDIQELLDHGSEFIVLSRGMQLVLQTCPETIEKLNELSIPYVIEETNAAVATYNRLLTEGKAVGGLFHSTC
jgi:hypothetical protein